MPAQANPEGGTVTAGSASISATGTTLDIHQQTDRAVIDWRSFDIQPNEQTNFHQPSTGSVTLNRVGGNAPSAIMGKLTANGNVVVVNPNGVLFSSGAQVDVGGLVATTADIDNNAFMAGDTHFNKAGAPDAKVINEGTITAREAGLVGLVAPNVLNKGVITAKLGRVELASGDTAVIDLYGNNLTGVAMSDEVTKQIVSNSGTIDAAGGTIAITAADGRKIVDSLVTIEGELKAPTIEQREGTIIIGAPTTLAAETNTSNATVSISASLDVAGKNTNEKAGAVHITGKRIALKTGTSIDASGKAGGGEVLIGGDYKGGAYRGTLAAPDTTDAKAWGNTAGGFSSITGSEHAAPLAKRYEKTDGKPTTASRVIVEKNVTVKANSDGTGNAGRVIYWSDNGTSYQGHTDVSATGIGAHAGFVEVSGKDWLNFDGTVNAHAAFGEAGALLLDPADITISNAANSNITGSPNFDSTGGAASNLNISTLQSAINSANIIISSAAGTGGNGDITFVDDLTWNSANSLTVNASRHITVNGNLTNTGIGIITLNSTIDPTSNITINSNISTNGSIYATAMRDLTLAGGKSLTTASNGGISLQAANGAINGTGKLTLNGNLNTGTALLTLRSGTNGGRESLVLDSTKLNTLGATISTTNIHGFEDITIDRNLTSTSGIAFTANRNLTVNAGRSIITGTGGSLTLLAANNSVTGTGLLTVNGNLAAGSSSISLVSGVSAIDGSRNSWTVNGTNFANTNTTFGSFGISGFNDLTIDRDIISGGTITLHTGRNLTFTPSHIIRSGTAGSITLQAAGAAWNGGATTAPGTIDFGGNAVESGTGNITLRSGTSTVDGSRPDWTINNTNLIQLSTHFGSVTTSGFNDVIIDRDITSSGTINLVGQRNVTLNTGRTLSGNVTLMAANTVATANGLLTLNGTIIANALSLRSGLNPADGTSRNSMTFNSTNLQPLTAGQFGSINIQGFDTLTFDRAFSGTSSFSTSLNNMVVAKHSINVAGAFISSNPWQIAEGLTLAIEALGINFSSGGSTLNGTAGGALEHLTLNAKTGDLILRALGNSTAFGNLTLIADNMNLNAGINGTGALSVAQTTAGRAVNLHTADAQSELTMGLNLNATESGFLSGFSSYSYGSSTAGALTNNKTSWTTPLTFLSGNDIINNAAFTTTGDIFMQAGRDIILNQDIATSSTGANALRLVAGRNFLNNAGADALAVGAGARWLVYSTDRTGTTNEESLPGTFNRYGCTFAGGCAVGVNTPGTGNGFLYSFAPTLTVTGLTANNREYDTTTATTFSGTASLSGILAGDTVGLDSSSITAAFTTKNVGTGKNVNLTGYTLTGTSLGYLLAQPVLTANITAKNLTVSGLSAVDRIYDATTSVALSGTAALVGIIGADTVTLGGTATGTFATKNIGTNKAVTVTGLTLGGADSGNYTITQPTGLTATVAAKNLTVSGLTADNKTYDATTTASLSGTAALTGIIGGDTVTVSGTGTASFATKNVGTNKAVTVTGLGLGGTDGSNYTVTQPTGLTANITKAFLDVLADNLTIVQGTTPIYNIRYDTAGFRGGENATTAGITGSASVSTPTSPASLAVGTYDIGLDVSGLSAANYQFRERTPRGIMTVNIAAPAPQPATSPVLSSQVPALPATVIKESQLAITTAHQGMGNTTPSSSPDTTDGGTENQEEIIASDEAAMPESSPTTMRGLVRIHPYLVRILQLPTGEML